MKKRNRFLVLTLVCGLLLTQTAFAAYSSYGAFEVKQWTPTYLTTTNTMLGSAKTTTSTSFDVYSTAKTMWSTPTVTLVNSAGSERSTPIGIAGTYTTYTGANNTGTVGYSYYAKVTPAINQLGTDTITLKVDPR